MSEDDDKKWDHVVAKLIVDTRAGTVEWEIVPDPSKGWYREEVLGHQYRSKISNRIIHLYEYRYKHYSDEDDWDWVNNIGLELVDTKGTMLWRFPLGNRNRYELLEVVRRATSGANDLIDRYLAGKPDDDEIPF
jgi:hypothetical protein